MKAKFELLFTLIVCCSPLMVQAQEENAAPPATTTDYVAKFTSDAGALGNSLLYDNGTDVGLGTSTPGARFEVSGSESTASGDGAAIQIFNAAPDGGEGWWLRVGATGTVTPAKGFSIANAVGYWLCFQSNGNMGVRCPAVNDHNIDVTDGAYENAGVWTNSSDRNLKENFADVNGKDLLSKINSMPIQMWNYKADKSVRHLGPVAQDFYAAFSLGEDDKHISTVDEGGVALAAVQQLYRMLQQKDAQIQQLSTQLDQLQQLQQTVQILSTRLSKIENADTNVSLLSASR
jgi:hypothetical protein